MKYFFMPGNISDEAIIHYVDPFFHFLWKHILILQHIIKQIPYHILVDLMPETSDVDNIRPVIRLHQHSCSMGTGHMEGGWTASV